MKLNLMDALNGIYREVGSNIHYLIFAAQDCNIVNNIVLVDAAALVYFTVKNKNPQYPDSERIMSFTKFVDWVGRNTTGSGRDYFNLLVGAAIQQIQDALVNWCAANMDDSRFSYEIVSGKDIVQAYKTGPDSCMKGKVGQLALYVENPEKVSLLKIYENGVYTGRSIRWLLDNGQYFLDRIYPGNGVLAAATRGFAKGQGWLTKSHDSVGFDPVDGIDYRITLKHPKNRRIGYLDSLRFAVKADHKNLTLGATYPDEYISCPSVGDFEGYDPLYSPYVKYLDGMPAVRSFEERRTWNNSKKILSIRRGDGQFETFPIKVGSQVQMRALRPTDKLYGVKSIPDFWLTERQVVKIGEYFYLRPEVRKVRNSDAYVPKATATKYKATLTSERNGTGELYKLEVVE